MADDGFGFNLALEDGISTPASAEARALKNLSKEIGEADKHLKALIVTQRSMASRGIKADSVFLGAIKAARSELASLNRQQSDLAGPGRSSIFARFAPSILGANLLSYAIRRVARDAVEAAERITSFIVEASELKQASVLEFGGGAEGSDLFNRVQQRAVETHYKTDEAQKFARDLKLQGLNDADLIVASVQSRAELIRTGQVAGAEKLTSIIEKSLASGHFEAGKGLAGGKGGAASGRALAGLGVHLPEFFADLARRYQTDIPHVKEMLKEGKVATEVGIAAIDEAISKGDVGTAARKLFTLTDFKTDVFNVFSRAAQSVDLSKFNKSLMDLDQSINTIGAKGGIVEHFFQFVVDGSANAVEAVSTLVDGIELGLLEIENAWKTTRNWLVDHDLGFIVNRNRSATGGIEQTASNQHIAETIQTAAGAEAGIDLSAGLDDGLQSGKPDVAASAAALGDAAENALRDKTKTHSPSEVFADVGYDMAAGVVQGWSAAGIESSIANSVGRASALASGPGTGGGKSVTIQWHGDVIVHGSEPNDEGKRATWLAAFTEVSEQFAMELGTE